jgi:hypothetical protein
MAYRRYQNGVALHLISCAAGATMRLPSGGLLFAMFRD